MRSSLRLLTIIFLSLAASAFGWSPTSLLLERLSTPILRRIWSSPGGATDHNATSADTAARRQQSPIGGANPPPPKLELIDIESYCFGNIDFVQLGPCSSTYLKCLPFNDNRQFALEECPLGKVFHATECKPAHQVQDCFNSEVNALNDATEKLAQATAFCSRSPFVSALYTLAGTARNGAVEDAGCTRQALLCRQSGVPHAISCPAEKVLDVSKLECVEAPEHCWFVSPGTFTPIKESLMNSYCDAGGSERAMSTQAPVSSPQLSWGTRCQNWYVTCGSPQPLEMVFCEQGKLFDRERLTCRRVQPEDQCPHVSTCHGWEWRTVALGECRTDFLYCNAMRPTLFQCIDRQQVFKDGRCVPTNAAESEEKCSRTLCQMGEKRMAEKCNEFFVCQNRTGIATTSGVYWQQYRCIAERVYNPTTGACVTPAEYQCPLRKDSCVEGQSYSIECGSFFYCHGGKWLWGRCPDGTRWAQEHKRCLADANCRQSGNSSVATTMACQSGEAKPSIDCHSYEECVGGQYMKQPCLEYSTNRFKPACRFCSAKQLESEQSGQYTVDSLLPANFDPFAQQGIRQRQCAEHEKIVNSHDCSRFMECLNGEWFNFACPAGYHFDPTSESCRVGGGCQGVTPSGNYSSVYMRPLYNRTASVAVTNTFVQSAPPAQIPTDLRVNYAGSFTFCDQTSVRRLGHPQDCSRLRECELQLGYYVDKQCPYGTLFDPKRGECSYEYSCPTNVKCVEGVRVPRAGCGEAKRCRSGEWENIHCRDNMAFINGRCSTTISCPKSITHYPHGAQCYHGQTHAHHQDCSKYLLCQFGQFVEERCHNGHRFNPSSGRCDPSYTQCVSSYKPSCYEGEMRTYPRAARKSIAGRNSTSNCDLYQVCIDEKWESQRCPYANRFNREKRRCEPGYCIAGVDDSMAKDGEEEAEAAKPRNGVKCDESAAAAGFRADGENCGRFYQCASGKWVSKECPASTVFNSMIGVCDWPANVAGC